MNKILSAKITLPAPMLLALVIVLAGLMAFNAPIARADAPNPAATTDPNLAAIPPIQKVNAKWVDGIMAAKTPVANKLLALNSSAKFPLSVFPQGSGSGLNADLLDGMDSTAFALAGHNHLGQVWTGAASQGLGVTNTTSTSAITQGLWAQTASTGTNSVGVFGVANATSGGVVGVWGFSNSPQGVGVRAWGAGPADTALEVAGGGIKVDGAGVGTNTPAFVQKVTSGNINSGLTFSTIIDNPLTNGDPNAILIITQNWNPGGGVGFYDTKPVGVWYDGTNWEIFHEDQATTMVVGNAYNVLVIKP